VIADQPLAGKTALITGGSRGLGLAMGHGFAAGGADIVIVSRKYDKCLAAADSIAEKHGVRTWAFACNVSSWDECTDLAEKAESATGGVDILVNNAGLSPLYPSLAEVGESLYDKVFGVNTKGPFRLTALLGTAMAARGDGSIINVSSIESLYPTATALPYAAAKAGLNTLTQGFAAALGPDVRVNAILAGAFLTDIADAWDMEKFNVMADRSIIMNRGGEPDEIVGAALFFASEASKYATGALLRIDGGVIGGIV
jgi:NAD(P)-dependent dehydrogenase (short-subunit alcohol dehydrogenase family)